MKCFFFKNFIFLAILALFSSPIASFFQVGLGVGGPCDYRHSYVGPVVYTPGWGWGHHRYCDDGASVAAGSLLGFAAGASLANAAQRPVDPEEQTYLLEKRRMLREQREKDLADLREEREQRRLEKKKQRAEERATREQKRLEHQQQ